MSFELWLSFVGTVVILAITPGPSVLLASANSLNYGVRKTFGTILGDLSANLIQMSLASLGLASIIISSGEIFQVIKWLGVGYLILVGIKKIVIKPSLDKNTGKKGPRGTWSLYKEGFLMSAANPKAIIFFAALFPLFISPGREFFPQFLVLCITFICIDGLSLLTYSIFAARLKSYLENNDKVHFQNKIVGVLLIFSGLMLSLVKKTGQ